MIQFYNQELLVSGNINCDNAQHYYLEGLRVIAAQNDFPVVVNLSALEQSNTLALAVLVRWLRQTPQAKGLQLKAVPEKMMNIIQACHLQDDLQIV